MVAALGIPLGAYCLFRLVSDGVPAQLLVFVALTVISGRITLKIPSVSAYFSPSGDVHVHLRPALRTGGGRDHAGDRQRRARVAPPDCGRAQILFNFGNLALSVWIAGTLFFFTAGVQPLFSHPAPYGGLLLPLAGLAAGYFLINSGLTATAIAFATRRPPFAVWREHFMWLGPGYAAGACVALLLVFALRQVEFSGALILILPVLLVFYATLRASFGRDEDAKGHVVALNRLYLSTVETLATAIDAKDEVTHGHIRRVQVAAMALAREIGITDDQTLKAIEAAALLHDTGKIAVPEHILNKPGKLTAAEFEKMKLHAPIGAEILSAIEFPYPVVPIVRHHHENWDGTGYPDRIQGEAIPIGARILSVVDCFDALTSDRPYRRKMTDHDAVAILLERRGTMYDPAIVDSFVRARHQIMPPPEAAAHPLTRTLGGARESSADLMDTVVPSPPADAAATSEVLAIASLARAISGEASLDDVGALTWMMLRQVVPCVSMGLFLYEDQHDALSGQYAAGVHAAAVRGKRLAVGAGVAGWCAANRRLVRNADPAIDLGVAVTTMTPPLRSSIAIPLTHDGALTGVLSLYSSTPDAFTDDHARLLTLMASSLASSIAPLPKTDAWTQATSEPRKLMAGGLRLLKR